MKRIVTLFAVMLVTISLFAQEVEVINVKHSQEFGFHAGATTGIGLSYRFWPGKNGIQITALPIKTSDLTFINVGLTGLHTFYDAKYIRFFGYLGSSVAVNDFNYDPYDDEYETADRTTKLNVGIGPGFAFGSRVRFNVMAGYGFYDILGEFNIYPTAEVGLYFRL
jgi:hypothetical protein